MTTLFYGCRKCKKRANCLNHDLHDLRISRIGAVKICVHSCHSWQKNKRKIRAFVAKKYLSLHHENSIKIYRMFSSLHGNRLR
ncbi:MAG: hypothetical protein FWG84_09015, partial [Bacteroidales bacterium]|nr:hypothetical protein [Bacteroidales bacterium]